MGLRRSISTGEGGAPAPSVRRGFLLGVLLTLVLWLGVVVALPLATTDSVIPDSCRQPDGVDYSNAGRADYGPYAVKFTSWIEVPGGWQSAATVGHGLSVGSRMDYGFGVAVESTNLSEFRCTWTDQGVTILEPDDGSGVPPVEHVVPAGSFLGGR